MYPKLSALPPPDSVRLPSGRARCLAGHILLETVLFIPLGMLFLFATIDVGGALWRRSRLIHGAVETVREAELSVLATRLVRLDENGARVRDVEAERLWLFESARALSARIGGDFVSAKTDDEAGWRFAMVIVTLRFDEENGALEAIETTPRALTGGERGGAVEATLDAPSCLTLREAVAELVESGNGSGASDMHALAVGENGRFLPLRSFVVLALGGQGYGIGKPLFAKFLPRVYEIDDVVVEPLRARVG